MKPRSLIAAGLVLLASCGGTTPGADGPRTVTLLAYDAFTPPEGIFDSFTERTGIAVEVVTGGDSGSVISKAILTAGNPEGDVLWGVDDTTLSRVDEADVLDSRALVSEGDVCVNYDKAWYADKGVAPPTSLDDLVKPAYRGQLVVQDPVNSSPGLAFLMASIARYGDAWTDWWRLLVANDVTIVSDWTTAYTSEFSGSSGKGRHPLVVSYGSSPPAEIVYAATPIEEPPTAVIESTCFRQVEYAGVLRGADDADAAQQVLDFLVGVEFQESMPLSLFVFPVNPDAALPEVFEKWAVRPRSPLTIPPAEIQTNRDSWLETWRTIAL
ncbi:MAG: thiamine ABC transporter substrate binding subunit [Actinomycetota bacterium]